MFNKCTGIEIIAKEVDENNQVKSYCMQIENFGIIFATEDYMKNIINSDENCKLVYKNGQLELRDGTDTDKFLQSLPVFTTKQKKLFNEGWVIGTVTSVLKLNGKTVTTLAFIAKNQGLGGFYNLVEGYDGWVMYDTFDLMIVTKEIDVILQELEEKYRAKMCINTQSFIDSDINEYYREDMEKSLQALGYNVSVKRAQHTKLMDVQNKLEQINIMNKVGGM